jgi:hypothetical protein
MLTTYHLSSADDLNNNLLKSIKAAYKCRPITITVEEDSDYPELSEGQINILEESLLEEESTYISAADSIKTLEEKYGI